MENKDTAQNGAPIANELFISDTAAKKIKFYLDEAKKSLDENGFRIAVKAGGCSGLEYDMKIDQKRFGDNIFTKSKIQVFVDGETLDLVKGSTLDYIESIQSSSFQIINPNATGSCGCGISFRV